METPDPPSNTPGASKQVVLTPHDIPRILRASEKSMYFRPIVIVFVFFFYQKKHHLWRMVLGPIKSQPTVQEWRCLLGASEICEGLAGSFIDTTSLPGAWMSRVPEVTLPETNSQFAPENMENPWKFGDSELGNHHF